MLFGRSLLALLQFIGFAGSVIGLALCTSAPLARAAAPTAEPTHPLVWDTTEKVIEARAGDGAADFTFTVKNTSKQPVTIDQIRPTCGCTVAEMPSTPWVLAPGASGSFKGTIDFRGKEGTVTKGLFVNSSAGTQMLNLIVKIPVMEEAARRRNQELAKVDRQAVLRGDCATCHVQPGVGKTGPELFMAVCGVCHFAAHRATIVPDLLVAKQHRDAEFWRKWITEGKEGTLMPAWSREHDGPLTREQIESLVAFAVASLPADPPAK